jgi:ankyrin repeat protein
MKRGPEMKKEHSTSDLIEALSSNDVDGVKKALKQGADPNVTIGRYEITALMFAAHSGFSEVGKALIAGGANVNAVSKGDGITALWLACGLEDESFAMTLIEAGANVNHLPPGYEPTLHRAMGKKKLMEKLLTAKADIDVTDVRGVTPLMLAVFYGEDEIVQMLLEKGADKELRDESNRNALEVCRERLEEKSGKALSERLTEGDFVDAFFAGISMFQGKRENWEKIEALLTEK